VFGPLNNEKNVNENFLVSSYYPNHGDYTHPLAALDPETLVAHNLDPNDDGIENEDDWIEAEPPVDVTCKMSAKTAAALAMEVSLRHPQILLMLRLVDRSVRLGWCWGLS
jgi:hypothetical protein